MSSLIQGLVLDFHFDFPAFVLLLILVVFMYVLVRAQSRSDFDLADMLRDERGHASSIRLAAFVCLGISSWAVMYMLVKGDGKIDNTSFIGYMMVWSGAKAVEKAIDAWASTKGNWPPKLKDDAPSQ